jgi:hypothetical protein
VKSLFFYDSRVTATFTDSAFLSVKQPSASGYALRYSVDSFNHFSNDFSGLIGGSFRSPSDFLHPFLEEEDELYYSLGRFYPQERLNAEGLFHWARLMPSLKVRLFSDFICFTFTFTFFRRTYFPF